MSSTPRPSQVFPDEMHRVRCKYDTIGAKHTPSPSSSLLPSLALSISLPPPLLFPSLWQIADFTATTAEFQTPGSLKASHPAKTARPLPDVLSLDIHHQHQVLYYAHKTCSSHHVNEKLLDQETGEAEKVNAWQSLPALNCISLLPLDLSLPLPFLLLSLFLSAVFQLPFRLGN